MDRAQYFRSTNFTHTKEVDRNKANDKIFAMLLGKGKDETADEHEASPGNQSRLDRLRLSTLRIRGVSLSGVVGDLLGALDLQHLESLCLQSCEHETSLLRALTAETNWKYARLRHLAIAQVTDLATEADRDDTIDKFLASFDSLESLIISAPKTNVLRPRLLHKQDAKQGLVCLVCQDQDKTRQDKGIARQERIVVLFAFLQDLDVI